MTGVGGTVGPSDLLPKADDGASELKRYAFYGLLQLLSVLLPGAAVILEIGIALDQSHAAGRSDSLQGHGLLGGGSSWFVGAGLIAAAYVVGYVGRSIGFRILRAVEIVVHRLRPQTGTPIDMLREWYGRKAVHEALTIHPMAGMHLLGRPLGGGPGEALGGALWADSEVKAFLYAKQWLLDHQPGLAPDEIEIEINIAVATLIPIMAGAWTAWSLGIHPLIVSAAVVGFLVVMVRAAVRLRKGEREEALRHLVVDVQLRLAGRRLEERLVSAEPQTGPITLPIQSTPS